MRLKYVTKMKIILCIFLLYITAVSVFGQSVELNGILGESVKFPAAVKINGNLRYSGVTIGNVTGGRFMRARSKFSGRLQWDSSTGLFSISGLRLEDSGVFTVQNSDEPRSVSTFSLTVKAVVGQLVELNGILGESVKFPAPVRKGGSLMHSGVTIGVVISGRFTAGKFSSRVRWDNSTGLFSLSGLEEEDSGIYTVQDTQQTSVSTFNLTVWKDDIPVSKPNVIFYKEYCTIECTAERGTGVTLSWYREHEEKPFASQVESAPYLHLPVPVERSGTYTCEVKNSVSNETASITVEPHCTVTAPTGSSTGTIVVLFLVFALIAVLIYLLCFCTNRERRAVKTLIQVKAIVDKVDPHSYDEQALLPDAHTTLMEVKELLHKVVPHAYGTQRQKQVVRTLIQVKDIVDKVDPRAYAVRSLIEVKELLDKVDPYAYGKQTSDFTPHEVEMQASSQDGVEMQASSQDGKQTSDFTPHEVEMQASSQDGVEMQASSQDEVEIQASSQDDEYEQSLSSSVTRSELEDEYEQSLSSSGVRDLIFHPGSPKKMPSSHPIEVPLIQATCEVGE